METMIIKNQKVRWKTVFSYAIVMLILPPIIGLPLAFTLAWKKASRTNIYAFFMQIAFYIGAVNATKSPGGDQIRYASAWLQVPQKGLIGSMLHIYGDAEMTGGKEFMNGVFNFFGYYMSFGYFPIFMFLMSIMLYMCIFVGLEKVYSRPAYDHRKMITGAAIVAFFYLFFNLSFVIQKQFLANGFFILLLSEIAMMEDNKSLIDFVKSPRVIIYTVLTIFTHTSFGLLLPFAFFSFFRKYLPPQKLVIVGLIMGFVLANLGNIAGLVDVSEETTALNYGIQRMQTEQFDDGLAFEWSRFFIVGLPMIFIALYSVYIKKIVQEREFVFFNTFFVLIAVVLLASGELLKYRYFMMVYSLMPFIIPKLADFHFNKRDKMLTMLIAFFVLSFYALFESNVWDYAPVTHIIFMPPIGLIFGGYSYLS